MLLSRSLVAMALALAGCASESVLHALNEKEANQVIELLADNDISAQKLMNTSGREVVYDISVPSSQRIEAIKALNEHEMPRRRDRGYKEIFAESGLIPTSSEEKAKRLAALEGEIERQLKLIDGVLDVEVQIVAPEESALRTTREQEAPTTASVTMKYLPRADGKRPITEPEVQAVVAAGIEKLMPENVVVLMRPVEIPPPDKSKQQSLFGAKLGPKVLSTAVIAVGALLVLLVIGLIFSQWQLRTVRGRLIRLQNEIARARKKPQEALPPTGTGG
jgi:type III secretion system YscJ/HrcJ family lipoprotein